MAKVVIIGAGSGFGGRLSIDILSREALQDSTIGLCDIHAGRLRQVAGYVERTIEKHNLPAKVVASPDRKELLPGADFVVTSVSVGGGAYWGHPYRPEIEIPRKYGVDQAVADTVGPGGVFRFLRTGPVQHQFFKDMERLCPEALALNHTNPMAMLTWLHSVDSTVRNVGLCHSVQGATMRLASYIGVPYEEVSYHVAGINHLAWVLEFKRGKEDLYPLLRKAMDDPEIYPKDKVRFEIMRHFGYFPPESGNHHSEYMPYFRQYPDLMNELGLRSREVSVQGAKVREWMKDTGVEGEEGAPVGELRRSHEYTTGIMEAVVTNVPFRFNGNVLNHGLIPNLPQGCCVEVHCMADTRGIHPCFAGHLPPQLAALDR